MRDLVEKVLERIRPQLRVDGADIELLGVDDGIVKLRLLGGCCGCPFSKMALLAGLETTLKDAVVGVRKVELTKA